MDRELKKSKCVEEQEVNSRVISGGSNLQHEVNNDNSSIVESDENVLVIDVDDTGSLNEFEIYQPNEMLDDGLDWINSLDWGIWDENNRKFNTESKTFDYSFLRCNNEILNKLAA